MYWSPEIFLTEQVPVLFSFKVDALELQFLDPGKGYSSYIPAHEQVELPIWRVQNVFNFCVQNELLTMKIPKMFVEQNFFSFLQSFRRDSCPNTSKIQVINLNNHSYFYYEAAAYIHLFFKDDKRFPTLGQIAQCYQERANWILKKALSGAEVQDIQTNQKKFTYSEGLIYKTAHDQAFSYNKWWISQRKSSRKKVK